ncbi:Uncharacterised protein [Sebaldella termitidis]|uniref:Uncharacterized protein n=1 Tax=Sebaldella termitidis (strain ATCC 33386 / NCTC 11300) TaxID=526218 RepID=D1AR03_SEBTE|nr:SAM-dependent methyltransferase [Sebaldella termitidis]ACZ07691.1 hypothetical protein Sterm_0819 [Sebaldella termitidis ATCC 33386]SUI22987.1 Uncharacterised protein [Sebaldella termitidis]
MFEKIKKKYALNNSYFKLRNPQFPQTPEECFEYLKEHNELPFRYEGYENSENEYEGDWWLYDCYVEYQKRAGVYNSQFFTPRKTAERMGELAERFFEGTKVLDACCGFGSLTKALMYNKNFEVRGLEIDAGLIQLYDEWTEGVAERNLFQDYKEKEKNIISNPPYEIPVLTEFLEWLYETLTDDGTAILLIPKGFIDKERPKKLVQILEKFQVVDREDMQEEFARTKIKAEIVVLRKNI